VDDAAGVAEVDAVDELEHEEADLLLREGVFVLREVLLEVVLRVLEHEVEFLLGRGVDDVQQAGWGRQYLTMLGCGCSSFRIEISRIAVEGTPSSSFYSLIFFSATTSRELRIRALNTTPYVPSPIDYNRSKLSIPPIRIQKI
jgi:hypothetical protein